MIKKRVSELINLITILWFTLLPLFWKLNLSKGSSSFYDVFSMAPLSVVHMLVFYFLLLFNLYFNEVSFINIFVMIFYYPFIHLSNMPFLTFRDVYLHAAPVQSIMSYGYLSYLGSDLPITWPATYYLHSIFSLITGLDLILSNYVIFILLLFIVSLIIYNMIKKLGGAYQFLSKIIILFIPLLFNHLYGGFQHYSRTSLSFIFLMLFFYVFTSMDNIKGYVIQIILIVMTNITHPFQAFFLVIILISYYVLKRDNLPMVSFSIMFYLVWIRFTGINTLEYFISLLKNFSFGIYLNPLVETFTSTKPVPGWGLLLRNYYKYSLILLLTVCSIFSVLLIKRKLSNRKEVAIGISLLMAAFSMLIFILVLPDWHVSRFTPFAAFPASFSLYFLIKHMSLTEEKSLVRYIAFIKNKNRLELFKIFSIIFVITLSFSVSILRFEKNYYYGELTHTSEISALSFLLDKNTDSKITIMSWITSVWSTFYNYDSSNSIFRLWYLDLMNVRYDLNAFYDEQVNIINDSDFIISGIRDEYTLSYYVDNIKELGNVMDNVDKIISTEFNRIYSNGYYTIYGEVR